MEANTNRPERTQIFVTVDVCFSDEEPRSVILKISDEDSSLFGVTARLSELLPWTYPTAKSFRVVQITLPYSGVSLFRPRRSVEIADIGSQNPNPDTEKTKNRSKPAPFDDLDEIEGADEGQEQAPSTPKNLPPFPQTPRKGVAEARQARTDLRRPLFEEEAEGFPFPEASLRELDQYQEDDNQDEERELFRFRLASAEPTPPITTATRLGLGSKTPRENVANPPTIVSPKRVDPLTLPSTPKKAKVQKTCEGCRIDAPSQKDHTCLIPSSSSSSAPLSFEISP